MEEAAAKKTGHRPHTDTAARLHFQKLISARLNQPAVSRKKRSHKMKI